MKLLIISHLIPFPLTEGGRVSQYALIDYLRNRCSITLLVFAYSDADNAAINILKENWKNVVFEVILLHSPIPVRNRRTVRSVFEAGSKAALHKANVAHDKIFSSAQNIVQLGADVKYENLLRLADFVKPREKKIIDQVSSVVEKTKPDLVQIEFVYLLDLSLCIPNKIKKIFIHHELRFKRIETEITAMSTVTDTYSNYLVRFCEITELELLRNFDAIFTLSENDKALLQQKLPEKKILSSPFPILDTEIVPITREHLLTTKLVFVGAEFHTPNKDAIEWYIECIADIMFQKLGFVLHVIGNWSAKTIAQYKDNDTVYFAGIVENLTEYCKKSIMVVPLRIGSGIRAKILYAAANGVPVVSTSLGSEGISDCDKICLTANTPAEFVEAVTRIGNSQDFAERLVVGAQQTLKKYYSQQVAGERRLELYKSIL